MSGRLLPAHDPAAVAEGARVLRAGGLVAFPTETVYGLGANAFDPEATARVFEVKARPSFDPLIVHLADAEGLSRVASTRDPRVQRLAARFWPGPLTLVLSRQARVPDIVTAGLDTVGVRVPAHPTARDLVRAAGTPVAAPSANPFGYVSPTTAAHVAELLGDRVDLILDGGPCPVGVESTIVSLVSDPPGLLRPGGVPPEEIEALLGGPLVRVTAPGERPLGPGQLSRHYATRTPLRILAGPAGPVSTVGRVGLLAWQRAPSEGGYAVVEVLAPDGRAATAAARLFAALRRLDALGLDAIVAESCEERGLGHAIMDRLRRSAARG